MTHLDDIFIGESTHELAVVEIRQSEFDRRFYEAILERNPNNITVLRRLVETVARCGCYDRSLALGQRLVELQPLDFIAHYNLACSYSMLNQVKPGLKALECALRLGYSDLAHLEADSDLDALRSDPRFDRILAASA